MIAQKNMGSPCGMAVKTSLFYFAKLSCNAHLPRVEMSGVEAADEVAVLIIHWAAAGHLRRVLHVAGSHHSSPRVAPHHHERRPDEQHLGEITQAHRCKPQANGHWQGCVRYLGHSFWLVAAVFGERGLCKLWSAAEDDWGRGWDRETCQDTFYTARRVVNVPRRRPLLLFLPPVATAASPAARFLPLQQRAQPCHLVLRRRQLPPLVVMWVDVTHALLAPSPPRCTKRLHQIVAESLELLRTPHLLRLQRAAHLRSGQPRRTETATTRPSWTRTI